MSTELVTEQTILDALRQVPREHWAEVQAYLGSLRWIGQASPEEKRLLTAAELLQSGLVGMWADRTDIGDSREFARRLRQQAQTRGRDG